MFHYQALEDVEKNVLSLKPALSDDGEAEPNQEQVLQIALEICKEGVLSLFVQNLPSLGWEVQYLHQQNMVLLFY
jgi:calcium binding protein 39